MTRMMEMTDQEAQMVLHTPMGYRYTLVIVAWTKAMLVSCKNMLVGDRLRMLEAINGFVDDIFTADALAVIEPACDTAIEMIEECLKVDQDDDPRRGKSLDLMASSEVFGHLLKLNPSMLAAIKRFPSNTVQTTLPQPPVAQAKPALHAFSQDWWRI
jgi:hypothetical protein